MGNLIDWVKERRRLQKLEEKKPLTIAFNKAYMANEAFKDALPFSKKRKDLKLKAKSLWDQYDKLKKSLKNKD